MAWVRVEEAHSATPDLVNRVIHQESRGNPNAVSPKGAFGLMQLMPDTAKDPGFGVKPFDNNANPVAENKRLGTDYLNAMLSRYDGDQEAALVAYNWGPGNADKWVSGGRDFGKLPRETQGYVRNIMGGQAPALGAVGQSAEAPNKGRWVPIESPEPAADFSLENKLPLEDSTSAPVTAGGAAKAFGSGAVKGATSLLGLPADARKYLASGIEYATGLELPTIPENVSNALPFGILGPGGEGVQTLAEEVGVPTHEPQNTVEEYAHTAGEFAPAVAMGPTGVARGVLGKTAQVGVRSAGVGSAVETAGRAAGAIDPSYKAPAELVAAMLAGGPKAIRTERATVRSTDDWAAVAKAAYDKLDNMQVGLSPVAMKRLLVDTARRLSKETFDTDYHKDAMALLSMMAKKTQQGRITSFNELKNMRTDAGKLSFSPSNSARFGRTFKDAIDDAWANAKPSDFAGAGAKNAREAQKAAVTAKEAYFMHKKGELVDRMAATVAGKSSQQTQGQLSSAVKTVARQTVEKINKGTPGARKLRSMFTKGQIKRLESLATDKGVDDLIKLASRYGAHNTISTSNLTAGGLVGYILSGDLAGAALAAGVVGAGSLAKGALNKRSRSKFDAFSDSMRGGADPRTVIDPTVPLLYGAQARPALPSQ